MKARIIATGFMVVVSMLVFASFASAQSRCSLVDVTPLSGSAGSTVYVSGKTLADSTVRVDFDGSRLGFVDTDVSTGNFGGTEKIPADATPGSHTISLLLPSEDSCDFNYTVVVAAAAPTPPPASPVAGPAAAPAVTPAALPAALPSTGFFLIVPAAGLVAAGAGGLLFRRRNRS